MATLKDHTTSLKTLITNHVNFFLLYLYVISAKEVLNHLRLSQVWCETNLRRCISKFHRFVCESCDKAFPLRSALDLHKTTAHPDKPGAAATTVGTVDKTEEKTEAGENGVKRDGQDGEKDALPSEQASFLELLGLQHVSKV